MQLQIGPNAPLIESSLTHVYPSEQNTYDKKLQISHVCHSVLILCRVLCVNDGELIFCTFHMFTTENQKSGSILMLKPQLLGIASVFMEYLHCILHLQIPFRTIYVFFLNFVTNLRDKRKKNETCSLTFISMFVSVGH